MTTRSKALPLEITATVICDDIRIEKSNKFILIGVYTGIVRFYELPTISHFNLWITGNATQLGTFELHMRVVDEKNKTIQGTEKPRRLVNEAMTTSTILFRDIPLEFREDCSYRFQIRANDGEWVTVLEKRFIGPDTEAPKKTNTPVADTVRP